MKLAKNGTQLLQFFCILFVFIGLTACSSTGLKKGEDEELKDPWEKWNRKVNTFNLGFDYFTLRPLAKAYRFVTPNMVDRGVTNFFHNLGEIPTGINSVLQGKPQTLSNALLRFLVNSTIGLFGFFDVAEKMGLQRQPEDFAQTLAVWGVPAGNYMILPILGPITPRGIGGLTVDSYTNPQNYLENKDLRYGLWGLRAIDARSDLLKMEDIIQDSEDVYVFMRTAYWQNRQNLIHDRLPAKTPDKSLTIEAPDELLSDGEAAD